MYAIRSYYVFGPALPLRALLLRLFIGTSLKDDMINPVTPKTIRCFQSIALIIR